MTKLWSDGFDYNEQVKHFPDWWKLLSRNNRYYFVHDGKERNVIDVIREYRVDSILDYGCGNSRSIEISLAKSNIDISVERYDPFVEEWKDRPIKKFDLVVCHNVLGGVEREYAEDVIKDLYEYANKIVMIKIPAIRSRFYVETINGLYGDQVKESSVTTLKEYRKIFPNAKDTDENMKYLYFLIEKPYDKEHESR